MTYLRFINQMYIKYLPVGKIHQAFFLHTINLDAKYVGRQRVHAWTAFATPIDVDWNVK